MANEKERREFWESNFIDKQEMWGFEPAKSALLTNDLFLQQGVKNILIPGIGYGRNAQVFRDNGMKVTGIEISRTAIDLAGKHYGSDMTIYHGSVTDMPFDDHLYEGIFCHALIHLLNSDERAKLIRDCYNQLAAGGHMVFTVISKEASTYGHGKYLSPDRYEMFGVVNIFFYDGTSIDNEFANAGLIQVTEVTEQYPFFLIHCSKPE